MDFGWGVEGLAARSRAGSSEQTHVLPYEADGEKEEVSQDPSL